MAVSSDVTISQDGGQGNAKLHPYLVALVRWCVSCVWSTATVLVHRLLFSPLPIAYRIGPKPLPKRPATHDHLHPEPLVECVVLHQPDIHNVDVIFVHGLYGSLGNTWRQGEWRTKYKNPPCITPLLRPSNLEPCQLNCKETHKKHTKLRNSVNDTDKYDGKYRTLRDTNQTFDKQYDTEINDMIEEYNENTDALLKDIKNKFYRDIKILPQDDMFVTENFYNNTLFESVEVVDNFETQAEFVKDLFRAQNSKDCDSKCDSNSKDRKEVNSSDCSCVGECEIGCGCVCDKCYSACWPKDWIKEDYPDARVISINYTSDPYLWRPLWKKECKRLRLHERAEQMTRQLLSLDVGRRPIVWVGHSKGGLFIKQIYCDAYEAYLKENTADSPKCISDDNSNEKQDAEAVKLNTNDNFMTNSSYNKNTDLENGNDFNDSDRRVAVDSAGNNVHDDLNIENENGVKLKGDGSESESSGDDTSSNEEEDPIPACARAGLWSRSAAFMFYSVPHRGSPLADIKTPITSRSIELMEICKDNSLVLALHARWAAARRSSLVRSVVETRRTLMSVLWLQIVSQHSADAGIGPLNGVNVDHREICKPTSRHCILYKELMNVMHTALDNCHCQNRMT